MADGPRKEGLASILRRAAASGMAEKPFLTEPLPISEADMADLVASGLFQADWYTAVYPDVRLAGVSPATHYRLSGYREGRHPNAHFDPAWYEANSAAAPSPGDPLLHYLRHGERNGLRPTPYFDANWYRRTYASAVGDGNALGHYLRSWRSRSFNPNPHFDVEFYLRLNPDVARAGVDPLTHFLTTGFKEGRDPSASFNVRFYAQRYLRDRSEINPLLHYLAEGEAAGHVTAPGGEFDSTPAAEVRRFTAPSDLFEEFDPAIAAGRPLRARLIAFYLPQFHPVAENDRWWGTGFTEWTNLARGMPRFAGHYQPRIPRDLGYYDLRDPSVIPRQIAMARAAGVSGFCFYYYNFNGRRLLEGPVERFLADRSLDMQFCIAWANENWTRRWDGADADVLMRQDYRIEDEPALVDDIARHFRDPRYLRISGRPLFILYRAGVVPQMRAALARWRKLFADQHGEDPLVFMAQAFTDNDPTAYGFDGAIEFPPHKVVGRATMINVGLAPFDSAFAAQVFRYDDIVRAALEEVPPTYPLIRTVFPSWDNDARRQGQGLTVTGSTPGKYLSWLAGAIDYAEAHPVVGDSIVFINAWNEWGEGAYLEPDRHFGAAFLNATARAAVGRRSATDPRRILLVGHDAFPAGAQHILLNLARTLRRGFGCDVRVVLCDGGALLDSFRGAAPTQLARSVRALAEAAVAFAAEGFGIAIVNTVAAGHAIEPLQKAGFRVIALVHEMPGIIAEKGLEPRTARVRELADDVVFPAAIVHKAFEDAFGPVVGRTGVQPQGLYRPVEKFPAAPGDLRRELGIAPDRRLVVNVGYGDRRKGVDLFLQLADDPAWDGYAVTFLWVGDLDPVVRLECERRPHPTIRFLGRREDVGHILAAADVFVLTSREDPFPSVVMEALAAGLPVVGFAGAGGFVDLLDDGLGTLVPAEDTAALAAAVRGFLVEPAEAGAARAARAAEMVHSRFVFRDYAFALLKRMQADLGRVSVVVPNYNYGRYLPGRLQSLFQQSYPIYEIVLLDDGSTDDSIAVAERVAAEAGRNIRIVGAAENSGSVFRQWAKAAELAKGDFVWIAEADDLADQALLATLMPPLTKAGADLAFCDSATIDADGLETSLTYQRYYATVGSGLLSGDLFIDGRRFAADHLAERNLILNASAVVWRKNALDTALADAGADLPTFRFAGDWLLYLNLCARGGSVAYRASPLNRHRRNAGGVTQATGGEAHIAEVERVHLAYGRLFGVDPAIMARQHKYLDQLRRDFAAG